ncbi:hypothetical protein EKTHUN627_26590 [Enterobacter kobei]|nr:hypothetical protein EKTHUN627_26590 [Enterobacter kobei]
MPFKKRTTQVWQSLFNTDYFLKVFLIKINIKFLKTELAGFIIKIRLFFDQNILMDNIKSKKL